MIVPILNFHDFVMQAGNKLVTDSRKVAKQFGKRHDHVIRAIRNMHCSEGFRAANFGECFEINHLANGKPEPFFQITRALYGEGVCELRPPLKFPGGGDKTPLPL